MALSPLTRLHHATAPASATIWKMLFDRQQALLHRWVPPAYCQALAALGLRRDELPDAAALAQRVQQHTGWKLLFVGAPVAEATYYAALGRRELPVVARLRTFSEFDQPPGGADFFSEIAGRVPLLLDAGYADALQQLGQAWELATTPAAVRLLRHFTRATFELGLLAGAGSRPHLYGATLLTSPTPLHALAAANVAQFRPLAGVAQYLAWQSEVASPADEAAYFVAQSWAELTSEIAQLRHELRVAPPLALGLRTAPASAVAGGSRAFAARVPHLRQAS